MGKNTAVQPFQNSTHVFVDKLLGKQSKAVGAEAKAYHPSRAFSRHTCTSYTSYIRTVVPGSCSHELRLE